MREMKFRVWDDQKNAWRISEFVVMRLDGTIYEFQTGEPIKTGIICQYTGLKDKNGKEIYEGDICNDIDDRVWIVFWNTGLAEYHIKIIKGVNGSELSSFYESSLYLGVCRNCEVIGNIYENPELIKEVD